MLGATPPPMHQNKSLRYALAAVVMFRIFDIAKPYPIKLLEKNVKGGWGVMIDDVVAAFYAYVLFVIVVVIAYKVLGYS